MGSLTDFKIEVHEVNFVNTDTYNLTYSNSYTTTPSITTTSVDANINVYVESITVSNAEIRVSNSNFTGIIHVQIIGS